MLSELRSEWHKNADIISDHAGERIGYHRTSSNASDRDSGRRPTLKADRILDDQESTNIHVSARLSDQNSGSRWLQLVQPAERAARSSPDPVHQAGTEHHFPSTDALQARPWPRILRFSARSKSYQSKDGPGTPQRTR